MNKPLSERCATQIVEGLCCFDRIVIMEMLLRRTPDNSAKISLVKDKSN